MLERQQFRPAPPAAVSRVLSTFDRDQLAGFIAVAIDLLDLADGDPDAEDDERDGVLMVAPGVDYDPAVDPPCIPDGLPGDPDDAEDGNDDEPDGTDADVSWTEWHTRGRHKLALGGFEAPTAMQHEDDEDADPLEDDDPSGGNVEDEGEAVNEDGSEAVFATLPLYGIDQSAGPINEREVHNAYMRAQLEDVR